MDKIHVTGQGETVDAICWRHYGRTAEVTEAVLAANPGLSGLGPVLPFGTWVTLPAISRRAQLPQLANLWN
ncbi:tail protein X [Pannonibacter tanglangensis]|uniref:Phage tail protein n=1 Tax=Pannonibacter tanglangensis TaxID=2750084 RepID=A0ABW9ZD47_9HYPH|nr:tail protein X [Pannonibacter sp. XCT-34]NBN62772.1 phage tail protein [Pannonibacter sp. XCT-34]